jgi:hypothetical protein
MELLGIKSASEIGEVRTDINFQDPAAVTVEALNLLGRITDRDEALDTIATAYADLSQGVSQPGELYVLPALGAGFTLRDMLTFADGANYPGDRTYPQTYPLTQNASDFNNRLWFPQDPTTEGYSLDEINRTDVAKDGGEAPVATAPAARFALKTGSASEDPLLQFLGLPYDEMYAGKGEATQLAELAKSQVEFAANEANEGLALTPINAAGFTMLALQARIRGEKLPVSWGFMRIPQLGRKSVGRSSIVGSGSSYEGQLWFSHSAGRGFDHIGVGLEVGQVEA